MDPNAKTHNWFEVIIRSTEDFWKGLYTKDCDGGNMYVIYMYLTT